MRSISDYQFAKKQLDRVTDNKIIRFLFLLIEIETK